MSKLKIDVLLPDQSLYSVLQHFTRKFFEALKRTGCQCRLLEGDDRYLLALKSPPDVTLGFNGALKVDQDHLYCDHIGVPHIACLIDPPFRFPYLTQSQQILITCDDADWCKNLRDQQFPRAFFLPHAVERELAPNTGIAKTYDVVMLSTLIDCKKQKGGWKKRFSKEVCRAMEEACRLILEEDDVSLEAALKMTFRNGLNDLLSQDPIEMGTIFSEVELYIKGRDKLDLLYSLTDCEVHVFGGGIDGATWEDVALDHPNIIAHQGVSFDEAIEIMKKTKILLNSSIKNRNGAHERIFSGAACGACVVTIDNPYIRQQLVDGKDCLFYRRSDFSCLNERVNTLLANPDDLAEMSACGRDKVMSAHTWDHRAEKLIADITPVL